MTLTASVVMPTYHGRSRLERTVPPLLDDPELHELVVVVDGSEDGSLELLEGWAATDPRVVPVFIANRGENGAREVGAARASGDIVVFVDDDVVAERGMLARHAAHHADGDRRVVVGYMPVALSGSPRRDDYPVRLYARWYEATCRRYEEDPDQILDNLWAGNVSMRRTDARDFPLARPEYDARYGPDRELGFRLREAGFAAVFDRSIRSRHLYTRPPDRWVADGYSAGEGMWLCHRFHPDALGPLTAEHFERGLGTARRGVVRLARRPRAFTAIDRLLALATGAAGRTARWHAQEEFAALHTRALQQRGALQRSRLD